jgi:hypothetical protein
MAHGPTHGFRLHPEACPRGERHYRAKLTVEDVRAIRREYATGRDTLRSLAKRYGVHFGTIRPIITGKTWKDVSDA